MGSGNLIEGSGGSPVVDFNSTATSFNNLEGYINKAFFGFAIPAVWTASNNAAFIVDSGYACGTVNPLTQYMTVDTQEATYSCYNGNLYYLASASGDWRGCTSEDVALPLHVDTVSPPPPVCDPTFFTAPPGMDALGPDVWGGLTIDDIVKGSVNTWLNNNKINGAPIANPLDPNTLDDLSSQNITTPGYIRLPVCSPSDRLGLVVESIAVQLQRTRLHMQRAAGRDQVQRLHLRRPDQLCLPPDIRLPGPHVQHRGHQRRVDHWHRLTEKHCYVRHLQFWRQQRRHYWRRHVSHWQPGYCDHHHRGHLAVRFKRRRRRKGNYAVQW